MISMANVIISSVSTTHIQQEWRNIIHSLHLFNVINVANISVYT